MRLLICAGGTGGGVYPALVILQALGNVASSVLWVGGEGGMEEDLVKRAGVPYTAIPAAAVHGVGLRTLPGNLWSLIRGVPASRSILADFRPDVILYTGGYVAVPMSVAARGIPSLVYVPDIEPGLALKFLSRFATCTALTTPESRQYFPANTRTEVTGYPTRPELAQWQRPAARQHLGLDPDRFTLLVTGGSKGARTLNRPFLAILPQILAEMQVVHITGQADWQEVQDARSNLPADLAAQYHIYPYLHEMGAALSAADLAVSRAGASVLGEYPLFGLPSILVPYPFAWRYQKVNADHLVRQGAAIMLETAVLSDSLLPTVLNLARDTQRLTTMRRACAALAQPDAAAHLARLVTQLAATVNSPQDENRENEIHG